MLSSAEKNRRHRALRHIIHAEDLKALLLIGDANPGPGFYGDYRYFTNNRTISYREAAVFFPDSDAVLLTTTPKLNEISTRSFVSDCLLTDNMVPDIIALLKKHGISSGRIGVSFEMMSAAWHTYLKQELPAIEWVEIHDRIMQIRFEHSVEEADLYRKGAALGDGSFEAALKAIHPGASEFQIVAELEYYSRARGAEEHFTQIGSGRFAFDGGNVTFYYPTFRRIEEGDTVLMEITPRYGGYWTQLVRSVHVGKRNKDLEAIQTICRNAIKKGLEEFKPSRRIRDVVLSMESYVAGSGFHLRPPLGHVCGVDVLEARVSPQNEMTLTPGMAVVLHPTVYTANDKNWSFLGETYLVTRDGYERLHHAADELITV
jgi:Xaa-Pro aminopeptidase